MPQVVCHARVARGRGRSVLLVGMERHVSESLTFPHTSSMRMQNLKFVGMMQYDGDLKLPANFLVPPPEISKVGRADLCWRYVWHFAMQ